ncbi:uncharacterized protein [Triticum aestivum]|uniref:uncharacterized protein n=1 Tax=Triticum aestivum TaxID=4565 RepID=UPI001D01AFE7|nr:uncharacterized protein LOC123060859 [Triticum aestivum]
MRPLAYFGERHEHQAMAEMKFRAKTYGVNCLKDGMICSMETISLAAFQLQFMFMALLWLHRGPWGTGSNTFATTKGRLLKHEDYEERIQSFLPNPDCHTHDAKLTTRTLKYG